MSINLSTAYAFLTGLLHTVAPIPGPKTQVLMAKLSETVTAFEDAADELAVDATNVTIEALAAKGHLSAFAPVAEGIADPLVTGLTDFFKGRMLGKVSDLNGMRAAPEPQPDPSQAAA